MKEFLVLLISVFSSFIAVGDASSQQTAEGPYFGQKPPSLNPEVFAPGIVSLDNRFEYSISFSPDGKECCFGVTNQYWSWCDLYYTKQETGVWTDPAPAYFQKGYDAWIPFITQDGLKLYFSSGRPNLQNVNIWVCDKTAGLWNDPVKMQGPVNTSYYEWRPTLTKDDVLYFNSNRPGGAGDYDIYRSIPENGQYLTVENIGAPVNSSTTDATPFIAPDGKYLIFESWIPGGYGKGDIYICYPKGDGAWTKPRNLGLAVNSNQIEDGSYVSPDGKYFFFNRRKAWITQEDSDIYWVDSRIIFKPYKTSAIRDMLAVVHQPFHYKVPSKMFMDYDDAELSYSACLSNGDPLPEWLKFDPASLTFFGKPDHIEIIKIKVIAKDGIGSSAIDEFSLFAILEKTDEPGGDIVSSIIKFVSKWFIEHTF